ncbi:hypothetical protein GCM10009853_029450 [Glycomyces scopariae]
MAARTWARVSGRMCGSSFTTRDTVFTDTPARSATSRIVTRMGIRLAGAAPPPPARRNTQGERAATRSGGTSAR